MWNRYNKDSDEERQDMEMPILLLIYAHYDYGIYFSILYVMSSSESFLCAPYDSIVARRVVTANDAA